MDPNETTQKLLNQDPFHEVKRKRDKKKEVTPIKGPTPVRPRSPLKSPLNN
ncbi:putative GBF-interacting protein [Helianthus annuus]|nr:putative GBF-interacting protein [Helianthus annuus]